MTDELENTGGVSRRSMLKKSALVGGTMVWAAPVVQSITSPAFGQVGTPVVEGQDISFIALALTCGGQQFRVKFEESGGTFILECGVNFATGNCPDTLTGGSTGCPSDLTADDATLNSDGSVTIDLGDCTITDFIVKCGQSCVHPDPTDPNPDTGDSGSVTFFPCPNP